MLVVLPLRRSRIVREKPFKNSIIFWRVWGRHRVDGDSSLYTRNLFENCYSFRHETRGPWNLSPLDTCRRPLLHSVVWRRRSLHVMAFVRSEWKFLQSVVVWRRFACDMGRENPPVGESSRLLLLQTERKLFDDGLKLKFIATFVNLRLFGV